MEPETKKEESEDKEANATAETATRMCTNVQQQQHKGDHSSILEDLFDGSKQGGECGDRCKGMFGFRFSASRAC